MLYEAEFAKGLGAIVRDELVPLIGNHGHLVPSYVADDAVQFTYDGDPQALQRLSTVIAVYVVVQYDIPRPKALLGHAHWQRLLGHIRAIVTPAYQSLYISAAGSESSVMQRIKTTLAEALGLVIAQDAGDLLLRIRRTPRTQQGWDVLIRLSARPLATRAWRICNYEGALNASVAACLVRLTNPTPNDRFLNIASGSGTIMIERAQLMEAARLIGCDIGHEAVACTQQNIAASSIVAQLTQADAISLPLGSATIDKLVADLPFGILSGSHDENEWLYPAIMQEAARVARLGAVFVIITQEVRLMDSTIDSLSTWLLKRRYKIGLSGLQPRIYVLERV